MNRTKPPGDRIVAVGVVLCAALAIVFFNIARHPIYTPDGFAYARVMITDAGFSTSSAVKRAEAYYLKTSVGRDPRYRKDFQVSPAAAIEGSKVIGNRVLYPLSASWLYPQFGLRSLTIVSAIAFVASGIALLAFLSLFSRPYVASLATVLVLLSWPMRLAASSDLTDMLAFFWWVVVLFGMAHYLSVKSRWSLGVVALASIALSLTRPVPYLPFVAALFCLGPPSQRKPGLALMAATALGVVSYGILAYTAHSGSLLGQLAWVKSHDDHQPHFNSLATWYAYAVLSSIYHEVRLSISAVLPLIAVIVAAIAMYLERQRTQTSLLIGATFGCTLAILLNPVAYALARVFELPLLPVIAAAILLLWGFVRIPKRYLAPFSRPIAR